MISNKYHIEIKVEVPGEEELTTGPQDYSPYMANPNLMSQDISGISPIWGDVKQIVEEQEKKKTIPEPTNVYTEKGTLKKTRFGYYIYESKAPKDRYGLPGFEYPIERLKSAEALGLEEYVDSEGNKTIGFGHLTEYKPLTDSNGDRVTQIDVDQAEQLLMTDYAKTQSQLYNEYPWVKDQPPEIQNMLTDLGFNMGVGSADKRNGLSSFQNTLGHIKNGDYDRAADGLENSLWYRQTGRRAKSTVEWLRNYNSKYSAKHKYTDSKGNPNYSNNAMYGKLPNYDSSGLSDTTSQIDPSSHKKLSSYFIPIHSMHINSFTVIKKNFNYYELILSHLSEEHFELLTNSNNIVHVKLYKYNNELTERNLIAYNHFSVLDVKIVSSSTTRTKIVSLLMVTKILQELMNSKFYAIGPLNNVKTTDALKEVVKKFNKRYYKNKPIFNIYTNGSDIDNGVDLFSIISKNKNASSFKYEQIFIPNDKFIHQIETLLHEYKLFYTMFEYNLDDFYFSEKSFEDGTNKTPKLNLIVTDLTNHKIMRKKNVYDSKANYAAPLTNVLMSVNLFDKDYTHDFLTGSFSILNKRGNVVTAIPQKKKKAKAYKEEANNELTVDEFVGEANNINKIELIDDLNEFKKRLNKFKDYYKTEPMSEVIEFGDHNVLNTNFGDVSNLILKDQYTFIPTEELFVFTPYQKDIVKEDKVEPFLNDVNFFGCSAKILYVHNISDSERDFLKNDNNK